MKKFQLKTYHITSPKIAVHSGTIRMLFFSDMHGSVFGEGYAPLLDAVEKSNADAILIGGDMVVGKPQADTGNALRLITSLTEMAPVYYALGNHEYRMCLQPEIYGDSYGKYELALEKAGVRFLRNECIHLVIRGTRLCVYGLEAGIEHYRKFRPRSLGKEDIEALLGRPDVREYSILLAHSPKFGDAYFQWGGDLTLSGHYHGGMLRLGENRGVIGPYVELFPAYCCGRFTRDDREMIVSAGLGEHTIPLRLHNPRELIVLEFTSP